MEYLETEKQPLFSEEWLEEYGNTLPDDYRYGSELDNSVPRKTSGSFGGGDRWAQVPVEDGQLATCWEATRTQFSKLMKMDHGDYSVDALKNVSQAPKTLMMIW